jgi:hypothetical protein
MEAIELKFGEGKVQISHFTDPDGVGLVLRDTQEEHTIGIYANKAKEVLHVPQEGEIYLKFTNKESAKVFHEMVTELLNRFNEDSEITS